MCPLMPLLQAACTRMHAPCLPPTTEGTHADGMSHHDTKKS